MGPVPMDDQWLFCLAFFFWGWHFGPGPFSWWSQTHDGSCVMMV